MNLIKKLFLLAVLAAGISGYAQKEPPRPRCFADELLKQAIEKDPEVKNRMADFNQRIIEYKRQAKPKSNTDPLLIPVIVYIVHASGIGNITDAQVMSQMEALNDHFAAADIQFCVATMLGNYPISGPVGSVQTTPGIIHVNSTALSTHNIESEQDDLENLTLNNGPDNYLRIWVVNQILEDGQASNITGYSVLPEFVNGIDGIVIENSVFGSVDYCPGCTLLPGYDQGKALAHEVGHYLGLQHTYFQGCLELTEGNCETNGDSVCDTPPAIMDFSCTPGLDSCNEPNNEPDDISNFMAYGGDTCLNHFTNGQIERMHASIESFRHELVDSDNLIFTGSCGYESALSATFTATNYYICEGGSISFDPLVSGATYNWNFGDPASGVLNTSNLQNPSHSFNSATGSPYTVTLTISDGTTSLIETVTIHIEDCEPITSPIGQWYFGSENGLNFSTGVPVYDDNANVNNNSYIEACAVQNEDDGDFLFSTNGVRVWNNSFTQINGTSLLGNLSSHGGALIVPVPGSTTQYRIFTKDDASGPNGFRSSIVDIINGDEAVMGTPVNQAITIPPGQNYLTGNGGAILGIEGVTAIEHCDGYWILTGNRKATGYFITVYNLTAAGGLAYDSEFELPVTCTAPHTIIKSSPNGNLIAYVGHGVGSYTGGAYLLRFDKFTGTISTLLDLNLTSGYGVSFSPNSQVLYIGNSKGCFQYDALSSNPAATRRHIEYSVSAQGGDFQLGPDDKIYITAPSPSRLFLSVIHNPNAFNVGFENECQFSITGPVVQENPGYSLPNNINCTLETAYTNTISAYPQDCLVYSFAANVCGNAYNWNFGDPASGSNTSNLSSPVHTFSAAGTYNVTANVSGTIVGMQITVGGVEPTITGLTTACVTGANQTSHSVILQPEEEVVWSIISGSGSMSMSTQPGVNVSWTSLPGTLRATVTDDNGCVHIVEQEITEYCDGDYCAENIEFNTPQPVATESYSVSNSIITENNYQVPIAADIELLATNLIHIKSSAWIKNGAYFLVDIQDCIPPPPTLNLEDDELQKLIVYPNPSTGLITLTGLPMYEITLHDILGKDILVHDGKGQNETVIDISQFQQGIYFLKVKIPDNTIQTIKIIKE